MKHFGKLALLGAVLAASASSALALPLTVGSLQFAGSPNSDVSYTGTGSSLIFTFNTPAKGTTGVPITGTFAGVITPAVDVVTFPTTINLAMLPASPILTITEGSNVATFTATSATVVYIGGFADVTFSGTVTETGFAPNTMAMLEFDTHAVSGSGFNSYAGGITAPATPEPNSLMLLGTGLVSAAGMLLRRRRVTV